MNKDDRVSRVDRRLEAAHDRIKELETERDELRAQINVLREALGKCRFDSLNMNIDNFKFCQNAFATTPEQSLAKYRNKVIEQMIACYSPDDSAHDYFDKLNALKDQK